MVVVDPGFPFNDPPQRPGLERVGYSIVLFGRHGEWIPVAEWANTRDGVELRISGRAAFGPRVDWVQFKRLAKQQRKIVAADRYFTGIWGRTLKRRDRKGKPL